MYSRRLNLVVNPMISRNYLLRLPTEMIQYIAYLLPKDIDVVHFSLCCSLLAALILPAQSSVWCARFGDTYDFYEEHSSAELRVEYQTRAIVLSQEINFKFDQTEAETLWLEVLRDMLLESYSCSKLSESIPKTFQRLRDVLRQCDFLRRPISGYGLRKRTRPSDLFCGVQLRSASLALETFMSFRYLRSDYNVGVAYAFDAGAAIPFVDIRKLDLESILHTRNFWLRHLLNPDEATFYTPFASSQPCYRPRAWENLVIKNSRLAHNCLRLEPGGGPLNWPPLFEAIIPTQGQDTNRIYYRGMQVTHGSFDNTLYLARGFVESIHVPQGGFPDWCRICFILYRSNYVKLTNLPVTTSAKSAGYEDRWFVEEWPPLDISMDFECMVTKESYFLVE
ncbi:uncharacterized protein BO97DRAFT_456195 [Aspergillus homomorphus CBS 101889]|uniref:Uncharacterized protein n=1 Tax=Aspergillus homomorphus (strain CBS 101889) TaxID=1450537 RepID=A0A395IEF0_ASPHC|nr:hypothetical protein BO97DRAFT_456195 [Aspergillus homomorphus CBS 101889]RAL16544.1 hypothetical protein BO97DRAFT_456195 [Aspergillus homomorphus CBS 101889]